MPKYISLNDVKKFKNKFLKNKKNRVAKKRGKK